MISLECILFFFIVPRLHAKNAKKLSLFSILVAAIVVLAFPTVLADSDTPVISRIASYDNLDEILTDLPVHDDNLLAVNIDFDESMGEKQDNSDPSQDSIRSDLNIKFDALMEEIHGHFDSYEDERSLDEKIMQETEEDPRREIDRFGFVDHDTLSFSSILFINTSSGLSPSKSGSNNNKFCAQFEFLFDVPSLVDISLKIISNDKYMTNSTIHEQDFKNNSNSTNSKQGFKYASKLASNDASKDGFPKDDFKQSESTGNCSFVLKLNDLPIEFDADWKAHTLMSKKDQICISTDHSRVECMGRTLVFRLSVEMKEPTSEDWENLEGEQAELLGMINRLSISLDSYEKSIGHIGSDQSLIKNIVVVFFIIEIMMLVVLSFYGVRRITSELANHYR